MEMNSLIKTVHI